MWLFHFRVALIVLRHLAFLQFLRFTKRFDYCQMLLCLDCISGWMKTFHNLPLTSVNGSEHNVDRTLVPGFHESLYKVLLNYLFENLYLSSSIALSFS